MNATTKVLKPVRITPTRVCNATNTGDLAAELRVAVMKTSRRLRLESSSDTLTAAQYSVLAGLRNKQHTIGELAAGEQITAPSMTRIVKSLLEAEFVTRTISEADARQVLIALTPEGLEAYQQARTQRTAWLALGLEKLDAKDRATLARAAALLQEMSAK
ncbi:MarR family winged helix-turn-helix transcriptional regulator [Paeniglutamicibacter gangotriensis]|uniref:MarR family transcriptional regulator n=1 Tax=Paeniglutamicibacter gangotriensis TaxID=254787 RepID=A0A5B0E4U6_9MICC|nr:MarR family transcriptional regulator [Paeniglutamicibacter gangotriensis]KAA0973738.1 MarR family transcriptional regulator [Paeniglutamicibacter gangotriensis]